MAFITAETRSSIVELAMGMLNQAPSTALLNTLIAKSVEGASIQDLADYIATTDAFTAEYPATQTAREFATEMFGKLITGGTLDADINTAVIDLLEGLLIAGTTKAQGFVAVIEFLANPANASHPDLGDISQSFQNRADAAEYFSITKELGGSTDAELAAAIASVTSDADTLTAANEAADATADAEEVVAGQTFTLTTGVDSPAGTGANDLIKATGTTLSALDSIDGAGGIDTLSISDTTDASAGGLVGTVSNVEKLSLDASGDVGSFAVVGSVNAKQYDVPAVTTDRTQATQIVFATVAGGSGDGVQQFTYGGAANSFTHDVSDAGNTAANFAAAVNASAGQVVATAGQVLDDAGLAATTASGATALVFTSATSGLAVGQGVSGTNIASGSTIVSISSDKKTVTLSAAVTGAVTTTSGDLTVGGGAGGVTILAKEAGSVSPTIAFGTSGGDVVATTQTLITPNTDGTQGSSVGFTYGDLTGSYIIGSDKAATATSFADALNGAAGGTVAYVGQLIADGGLSATTSSGGTKLVYTSATSGLAVGQLVEGNGIATGTTISAISTDKKTITLSAAVTADVTTSSGDLTFGGGDDSVTVPSTTLGASIPTITFTGATANLPTATTVAAAKASVAKTTYSASGFSDEVNVTAGGDVLLSAAKTADVTVVNTGGTVEISGGKTVSAQNGAGSVTITGSSLTEVTVAGGTGTTIDNLGGALGTTSAEGETLTSVTLASLAAGGATLNGDAITSVTLSKVAKNQTVTINNDTTGGHALTVTASSSGSIAKGEDVNVTDANATSITLISAGTSNSVDLNGSTSAESITVTGSAPLKLAADIAKAVVIDAETTTGGVDFGAISTGTKTLHGGAGADVLKLDATAAAGTTFKLFGGNDRLLNNGGAISTDSAVKPTSIDGGEGSDLVAISFLTNGNVDQFTNFEVLGLDRTSGEYDAALLAGIESLELLAQPASGTTVTYTGLTKDQSIVVTGDTDAGAAALTFGTANVIGSADEYSISFNAKGSITSTESALTEIDAGTLIIEGIEHVKIDSSTAAYYTSNVIDLTSAKLKTVEITGNAAKTTLGFSGTVGTNITGEGGAVSSIDASTMNGDVILSTATAAATAITIDIFGLTIKTGSGDDQINVANKATVIAGDGDDQITLLHAETSDDIDFTGALSTLTGGAGDDVFNVSAVFIGADDNDTNETTTALKNDAIADIITTVTDFEVGDSIDFSAGTEDAETALGAPANLASATTVATAVTAIAVAAGAAGNHIGWGIYGGNTYVVHNADKGSGTDTAVEAGDVVVKLMGVYDLSEAAFSTGGVLTLG